jgi:hypothetical protein
VAVRWIIIAVLATLLTVTIVAECSAERAIGWPLPGYVSAGPTGTITRGDVHACGTIHCFYIPKNCYHVSLGPGRGTNVCH